MRNPKSSFASLILRQLRNQVHPPKRPRSHAMHHISSKSCSAMPTPMRQLSRRRSSQAGRGTVGGRLFAFLVRASVLQYMAALSPSCKLRPGALLLQPRRGGGMQACRGVSLACCGAGPATRAAAETERWFWHAKPAEDPPCTSAGGTPCHVFIPTGAVKSTVYVPPRTHGRHTEGIWRQLYTALSFQQVMCHDLSCGAGGSAPPQSCILRLGLAAASGGPHARPSRLISPQFRPCDSASCGASAGHPPADPDISRQARTGSKYPCSAPCESATRAGIKARRPRCAGHCGHGAWRDGRDRRHPDPARPWRHSPSVRRWGRPPTQPDVRNGAARSAHRPPGGGSSAQDPADRSGDPPLSFPPRAFNSEEAPVSAPDATYSGSRGRSDPSILAARPTSRERKSDATHVCAAGPYIENKPGAPMRRCPIRPLQKRRSPKTSAARSVPQVHSDLR